MFSRLWCLALLCCGFSVLVLGDEADDLLRGIKAGPAAARTAWDKLVARGPAVLPRLLETMDTPDTVAANWLRTAFDRIVDAGGKDIDADVLLKFAGDRKRQGRARRLALDTAESLRPGSRAKLVSGAIDDPEFRYDAIELAVADPAKKDAAAYRRLFDATPDLDQARRLQTKLKELGVTVSVADHMGFLREWFAVGPFDANNFNGFKTAYPPEKQADIKATYAGKAGKQIAWKRFSVVETTSGRHAALVDLRPPLGDAEDAVAYAWTALRVKEARDVEFRGAADDNFTVWVNGKRVFGFEEYRNGVRLDRHRFKVRLESGVNTVLVKVCQAPLDAPNRELNWEFLLRVCDETGKGIDIVPALP